MQGLDILVVMKARWALVPNKGSTAILDEGNKPELDGDEGRIPLKRKDGCARLIRCTLGCTTQQYHFS